MRPAAFPPRWLRSSPATNAPFRPSPGIGHPERPMSCGRNFCPTVSLKSPSPLQSLVNVTALKRDLDSGAHRAMIGLRAYRDFFWRHRAEAVFGFGTLFFSCFGQTFFISLFVPVILADLALDAGAFGPLYAAATVCCGLLMPSLGSRYDTTQLTRYAS